MTDHAADLIIRGGTVVDGGGADPFRADVAVKDGRIVAVGDVPGRGREELDATGCIVTPGFIDIHTHYDGQAIWSRHLAPSSLHGVTTVVMGNCGVGFAPCRAEDRELLVSAMEGVEDIPGIVMTEGLTWDWESFPQFMDALAARLHDINIAAYLPHSALRVYVMGARGANREPATPDDLAKMYSLTKEAISAGAIGFATSSIPFHRRGDGEFIPSFQAHAEELLTIARAVRDAGGGVFQMVCSVNDPEEEDAWLAFDLLERIVREVDITVTFTLAQIDEAPERVRKVAEQVSRVNAALGRSALKPQIFPRPIGILAGLSLSTHAFATCPTYKAIAHLPLAERVAELRRPEFRERLISEAPDDPTIPMMRMGRMFDKMFRFGCEPDYEPPTELSVLEQAKMHGRAPEEIVYDWLLEEDGNALLYIAAANYAEGNLDTILSLADHRDVVLGLGDGGAHYGFICDASYPTFVVAYLTRDRERWRMPLAKAIRALSRKPAQAVGLDDRGLLAAGYAADINIIDYDALTLGKPFVTHDLPAGGRRIMQTANGYRATIVNGAIIARDGKMTGHFPGAVIRTQRSLPDIPLHAVSGERRADPALSRAWAK